MNFEEQFIKHAPEPRGDECARWTGGRMTVGYGAMSFMQGGRSYRTSAHRYAWERIHGPIPAGLVVDHTCHNRDAACPGGTDCDHRLCVNVRHFELVNNRTNLLRGKTIVADNAAKTHCPSGHAYDAGNTYTHRGLRYCRTCRTQRNAETSARRRRERAAERRVAA